MNEIPQISSDRLVPLFWGAFADFLQEERDNILSGVSRTYAVGSRFFSKDTEAITVLPIMSSIQSTTGTAEKLRPLLTTICRSSRSDAISYCTAEAKTRGKTISSQLK